MAKSVNNFKKSAYYWWTVLPFLYLINNQLCHGADGLESKHLMKHVILSARKAWSLFAFLLILSAFSVIGNAQEGLWLRYPAISPDGQTLLFEYKGDIWSVPAAGGTATPMTLSESYEFAPVWSHDGKTIAFASDRYGQFDVFVMPATGGEAKRLTFNSSR